MPEVMDSSLSALITKLRKHGSQEELDVEQLVLNLMEPGKKMRKIRKKIRRMSSKDVDNLVEELIVDQIVSPIADRLAREWYPELYT